MNHSHPKEREKGGNNEVNFSKQKSGKCLVKQKDASINDLISFLSIFPKTTKQEKIHIYLFYLFIFFPLVFLSLKPFENQT